MAELKPCPFCGYSAVLEINFVRKGFVGDVKCNRCLGNMHTITLDSPEEAEKEAIEAWNRRYTPSEIDFDYEAEG